MRFSIKIKIVTAISLYPLTITILLVSKYALVLQYGCTVVVRHAGALERLTVCSKNWQYSNYSSTVSSIMADYYAKAHWNNALQYYYYWLYLLGAK